MILPAPSLALHELMHRIGTLGVVEHGSNACVFENKAHFFVGQQIIDRQDAAPGADDAEVGRNIFAAIAAQEGDAVAPLEPLRNEERREHRGKPVHVPVGIFLAFELYECLSRDLPGLLSQHLVEGKDLVFHGRKYSIDAYREKSGKSHRRPPRTPGCPDRRPEGLPLIQYRIYSILIVARNAASAEGSLVILLARFWIQGRRYRGVQKDRAAGSLPVFVHGQEKKKRQVTLR